MGSTDSTRTRSGTSRREFLAQAASGTIALAGGVLLATAEARSAAARATGAGIALTHVTVIDATGTRPLPDATVVVRGERIVALGRSGDIRIPPGAEVLDLTGKFLIPGLCDMHVHSSGSGSERIAPPLYIANGVTTVREMDGSPRLHEWRAKIEDGSLLGPRMVIASPILDGSPSPIGDPGESEFEVTTEAEARSAVRRVKREGADFVKVYHRLTRAAYVAIADEAKRQGIPFAGHCPDAVPITDASDAGQASLEHLFWTWFSTSSREAEIRAMLQDIGLAPGDYNAWFHQIHPVEWTAAHSYAPSKAEVVFARLAANGSRQVPTLAMHRVLDRPDDVSSIDERLKYLPAAVVEGHRYALTELYQAGRTAEAVAEWRELFDHRLRLVGAMRQAGLAVLAGSDTGTPPYSFPGFSLHDELALLVEAGFTPLQALQAATREPAEYLGLQDSLGTIEEGKVADLVVLDGDPLADIRNTMKLHAVLVGGGLLTSEGRTRVLADVETAAREQT
jgi:hypothetical protein